MDPQTAVDQDANSLSGINDLSYFFNTFPQISFVVLASGNIIKVNNLVVQTFGYSFDELSQMSFLTLIHPDNLDAVDKIIRYSENKKESKGVVIKIKNKSGAYTDFLMSAYKPNDDVCNIILENNKRKIDIEDELSMKNRELAEAKAKDDAMLENIGDGVIGIDDGGEIIFINSQAQEMLGYSEKELKGKLIFHTLFLVDEKNAEVSIGDRPISKALKTKTKVTTRDYFYRLKNNSKLAVAITATPVVVFDQNIGGVIVFRDITREKEVDRMKTEFISLASHQLRTPLSAIKWLLELLIGEDVGNLSLEQKKIATDIYESNERMIDLVGDLLNISRIESGKIVVQSQPVDLADLAREAIKELQPKIDVKNIKISLDVNEKLPEILADKGLIRNVLMNLISNSVKYSPEGKEIIVKINDLNENVGIEVIDQGYGIPKNQQYRVFEKFFRATNTSIIEAEGTGLGLYLAKSIIDSSGGSISFKSAEGEGTTFSVTLPKSGPKPKKDN